MIGGSKGLNKYEEKMITALRDILGGDQKAFSYQREDAPNKLDILFAKHCPSKNYLTASTLGLVNRATGYQDKNTGKEIRAEIIMSSYGGTDMIGKILTTAGVGIFESNIRYGYGTVLKGVLEAYYPNSDMKHLFLMLPPPIWSKRFGIVDGEDCSITFLYALPISQAECDFMAQNGIDALQNKFVEVNIDMFDLERKSVF
ncbi:MAG: suppressor of fused domain protein [Ruminococcus sp.]|nr:suppressor of fused domain protein [Ruminococcus sp.]